jgi:hypothetical protein
MTGASKTITYGYTAVIFVNNAILSALPGTALYDLCQVKLYQRPEVMNWDILRPPCPAVGHAAALIWPHSGRVRQGLPLASITA